MKRTTKKLAATLLTAALLAPVSAFAADDVQQKIDALQKELEALKEQMKASDKKVEKVEEKSLGRWLTIGGDYRFRIDSLRGEIVPSTTPSGPVAADKVHNDSLMTHRFGLNLKAKATKDVSVTARLLMYKTSGSLTANAVNAGYFADRNSIMDGTIGHVPKDNTLLVDQVYATWANIADQPIWFSAGRRPSTGGIPTHLRQNKERPGNAGVPGLLVDYAFDGMTLGWAPDIDGLPGAYAKLCYGRGFDAGFNTSSNSLRDTDMLGVNITPVDTDPFRLEFQWNRGFNIFNDPNTVTVELGDIDWYGFSAVSTLKKVGAGDLQLFASGGMSIAQPNGNQYFSWSLMNDGSSKETRTGFGAYVGGRYDFPTGTKLGVEYNYGSRNWIPFDPASDDIWTAKLGTRGHVYEGYLIQELPLKPISSYLSKAFFRVGGQYYDFEYTGSNNWVGAAHKIADLKASDVTLMPTVKNAYDIYGTFEVHF